MGSLRNNRSAWEPEGCLLGVEQDGGVAAGEGLKEQRQVRTRPFLETRQEAGAAREPSGLQVAAKRKRESRVQGAAEMRP